MTGTDSAQSSLDLEAYRVRLNAKYGQMSDYPGEQYVETASYRRDVFALLGEVERLRDQIAHLTGYADGLKRGSDLHEQRRGELEKQVERLRKRTHEIQEAADKRCALLSKTVEHWRSSLALADSYLEESGVVFHSSVTRAKAASLFQQIATLQAHLAAQTEELKDAAAYIAKQDAESEPESAVVEAARNVMRFSERTQTIGAIGELRVALARLDAADVPAEGARRS